MYLDFYKLNRNPFHITPDPAFLFLTASHQEAAASISYGVAEKKGFIAITGEVGVGKTTILRSYLQGLDPARNKVIYIFNTALSFQQLLKQICLELGIEFGREDAQDLVNRIFRALVRDYREQLNVLLIIDEAQNMPVDTLERLRMLSNLETSEDKLLQIIMVGQPEFDTKLKLPELRQLNQRIAVRARIEPLSPGESRAYMVHRMMKASSFFSQLFTEDAMDAIISRAGGIPRVINILSDNALITGFGYQRNPVGMDIVEEVICDLSGEKPKRLSLWKRLLLFFRPGTNGKKKLSF